MNMNIQDGECIMIWFETNHDIFYIENHVKKVLIDIEFKIDKAFFPISWNNLFLLHLLYTHHHFLTNSPVEKEN